MTVKAVSPKTDVGPIIRVLCPLDREWGARKRLGDTGVMNCGDNHWMKYEGGTCDWKHLQAANAVTVERHALRISQPVEKDGNSYELDCYEPGRGRIFSRMDMSGKQETC